MTRLTFKRLLSTALAIIMLISLSLTVVAAEPLDTASEWARDAIKTAIENGYVPADIQDNYKNVITRAEFCRMAVMYIEYAVGKDIKTVMADKGVSRDENAFSDTNDPYILAAYALGITNGTDAAKKLFTPGGQFSREQAATMIMNTCRAMGVDVSNPSSSGFEDMDSASSWAVSGINFCSANRIMNGTSTSPLLFSPKATYTREQSIMTFNNISLSSLPDHADTLAPVMNYTHKTGKFSDISADDYVKSIKTGVNFLGSYNRFDIDWIDLDNYTAKSINIPIRPCGRIGDVGIYAPDIVMHQGDSGYKSFLVTLMPVSDGSKENYQSIGFGFNLNSEIKLSDLSTTEFTVKIQDAKIVTGSGKSYPLNGLNGTHTLAFEDNAPFGVAAWFETNANRDKLPPTSDLEGLKLEAYIEVIKAPEPIKGKDTNSYYPSNAYSPETVFDLKYFDALKDAGFNAVRLNIDWAAHIDNKTYKIEPDYLKAVEKAVGYITNLDMFAMITMQNDYAVYENSSSITWVGDHFERQWMFDKYKTYVDERFAAVWKEIAEYFKDYDEYVMFQAQNEPCMGWDEKEFKSWQEYVDISVRRVNEMNQIFVDAVRSTGGNNSKRFILFEGYTTTPFDWKLDDLKVPKGENLILSMHCYPAQNPNNEYRHSQTWSSSNSNDTRYADSIFDFCVAFTKKTGIPVIMDETGVMANASNSTRAEMIKYFYGKAKSLGVPCFWWEAGDPSAKDGNFALTYDLRGKKWVHADLLKAMMDVVYER